MSDLTTISDHEAIEINDSGFPKFECHDCGMETSEESWFFRRDCI